MELLSYGFMQRAFIAAALVGLLCSIVSFFVVLKRLSFVGMGVSHSALGGVAIGAVADVDPLLTGGVFATIMAWIIGWISRRGDLDEDTVIGTFSAASMALGVVILGFARTYTGDLMSFLFGNILAITTGDLWLLAAVTAVVIAFIGIFFKELLTMTFDEEMAQADGLPVTALYFGLLTAIALTVIVTVKAVGVVLSSALVVIPAAVGFELAKDYRKMLLIAVITGVSGSIAGLVASYYLDAASGATIALALALVFLAAYTLSPRKSARRRQMKRVRPPSLPGSAD